MKLSNLYVLSAFLKWRRICRVARKFATSPIIVGCRRAAVAIRATAFALLLGAPLPLAAQTGTVNFFCTFANLPSDCGFGEQSYALPRATIVNTVARDGGTSVRLHTEPGDNNVAGSGINERDDLSLGEVYGEGIEQWWAHSILFPDDYVDPPESTVSTWNWGVVFDFHNSLPGGGLANFQINAWPVTSIASDRPTGLGFQIAYGQQSSPTYQRFPIGPVVRNVWYDFVYHVKWSSGPDGFFKAWVNGALKMDYSGPTIYAGQGVYLKLANYHTPFGLASSVIHDRVIRGTTQTDVSLTPLEGVPSVVVDTQAPSIPANLTATVVLSSQIDLSWSAATDNVGVSGYYVYRDGAQVASVSGTSYSNTGLSAGTTYSYAVAAYDAAGNVSTQSSAVSAITPALAPTTTLVSSPATPTTSRVVRSDFNGDGKSDILWHNSATGENAIWLMNATSISSGATFSKVDLSWSIAGVGDFDGDGKADILWRNSTTGQNVIWLMNGTTITSGSMFATVTDLNWSITGVGDFNGDGKSDILWRNQATGENVIWLMNGTTILSNGSIYTVTDLNWNIVGVGDFDGDGKSDILWRNSSTGQDAMFLMNGLTLTSLTFLNTVQDSSWSITLH